VELLKVEALSSNSRAKKKKKKRNSSWSFWLLWHQSAFIVITGDPSIWAVYVLGLRFLFPTRAAVGLCDQGLVNWKWSDLPSHPCSATSQLRDTGQYSELSRSTASFAEWDSQYQQCCQLRLLMRMEAIKYLAW
jgi:hypothetical protein